MNRRGLGLACVAASLLAAGCGDVEVRGRVISEAGPDFAGFDVWFGKSGLRKDTTYDQETIGADGTFSAAVPADAIAAGKVRFKLTNPDKDEVFDGSIASFDGGAPGSVDLGDISLWNPQLHLETGRTGIRVQWTPPPSDLQGTTEVRVSDLELAPSPGGISAPSWLLEDRGRTAFIYWRADQLPSYVSSLGGGGHVVLPVFAPSAAADAPCFAYLLDPENNTRAEATIGPCVLTDRNSDTWFALDDVSVADGATRGIVVDLGDAAPLSRIVVRTQESSPSARLFVAEGDESPRFVGELATAVTAFDLNPPLRARKVFVESAESLTIIDVAAFTPDEVE